ncbi:IPT/TIG domain-containing protein [Streptomyces violaceusniger]|uniref:IPT/TIG domain-containing protein n=1 Tax=Streptomyces violaceusniger TaxID=68280 RepID=UPI00382BBE8F
MVLLCCRDDSGRLWRLADTCRTCTAATPHAAVVTEPLRHSPAALRPPRLLSPTDPAAGRPGGTVQIDGTSLSTTTRVNFGSAAVIPTSVTATQVTFVVPDSAPCAGQVSVSVTSTTGATSNALPFFVIAPPTTTGLSLTCLPAATGGPVTLLGANFLTGTQVRVGTIGNVAVTPSRPSQVTFTAPANPGRVGTVSAQPVTITTAGGTSRSGTTSIDYYLAPTITSTAPTSGTAEDEITINGTGLVNVDTVTFTDSAAATATAAAARARCGVAVMAILRPVMRIGAHLGALPLPVL